MSSLSGDAKFRVTSFAHIMEATTIKIITDCMLHQVDRNTKITTLNFFVTSSPMLTLAISTREKIFIY